MFGIIIVSFYLLCAVVEKVKTALYSYDIFTFIFWRSVCPFLPLKIYDLGIPKPEASSITFVIHLRVENMCLQTF